MTDQHEGHQHSKGRDTCFFHVRLPAGICRAEGGRR
jgi:hypothetical protein